MRIEYSLCCSACSLHRGAPSPTPNNIQQKKRMKIFFCYICESIINVRNGFLLCIMLWIWNVCYGSVFGVRSSRTKAALGLRQATATKRGKIGQCTFRVSPGVCVCVCESRWCITSHQHRVEYFLSCEKTRIEGPSKAEIYIQKYKKLSSPNVLFTGAKHSMFIPACSRSRNQTKWPNGIEMTHNSNSHRFSSWVRPKIFLFIGIHHTHDRMPYTRQCYALRYLLRYEYGYYTAVPMHCDSGFIQFSVSSGSQ